MKLLTAIILLFLSFGVFAQKTGDVLAMANGRDYTAADLSPNARRLLEALPQAMSEMRRRLLERQINETLLETEAAARRMSVEQLIKTEVEAKSPAPNAAQIKAVYDANQSAIGGRSLEEVRPQIVAFLQRDARQKNYAAFVSDLKTKHKIAVGAKDVNAQNLTGLEVLATVGNRQISTSQFETTNRVALAELEAEALDAARESLETAVYYDLLAVEAKTQNLDSGDLIAREVTGKARTQSAGEIARLEADLRQRLFQKYNAKFFLKESPTVIQNISVDDDPAQGAANASVTVVMFTDFQCPACAATHPVVKSVLADYADRARFVVRDFPLESLHENAVRAAVAANAARAQGKFFEFAEVLYQNQTRLDAASLARYAADLKLDARRFAADANDPKSLAEVRKDLADGKSYGINSTPTIFVNGVKVRNFSAEAFRRQIEKALRK